MKRILLVAVGCLLAISAYAEEQRPSKANKPKSEEIDKAEPTTAKTTTEKQTTDSTEAASEISDAASNYKCEHASMVRKIQITNSDPQANPDGNACEVKYIKETEKPGEEQTLWTAKNDREYCVEKAAGLANKLEGWGWSCTAE